MGHQRKSKMPLKTQTNQRQQQQWCDPINDLQLIAGLNNGSIFIIDCGTAKISKDIAQVTGSSSLIQAMCPMKSKQNSNNILISTEDAYILYDLTKQTQLETFISMPHSKKKSSQTPTLIDVSPDDQYIIEAYAQSISLRSLKSKQVLAKYEGHQYAIRALSFITKGNNYGFISAANNECLIWNPKEEIKQKGAPVSEITQPEKILDFGSSDLITQVKAAELEEGIIMASISSDQLTNVYYTKSHSGKQSTKKSQKNKVKKRDIQIKLQNNNQQIIQANIAEQNELSVVYGSIFSIKKSQVHLVDDHGKVLQEIVLKSSAQDNEESKISKKGKSGQQEDYNVVGIEEEGNAKINGILQNRNQHLPPVPFNLSLLPDDLDHLESRLTSVSSKKTSKQLSGSLSVILSQALTADDTEQLDWIFSQKDQQMITSTLVNIKEHRHISALFKQIVIKFQQEGDSNIQQSVVLWLKGLLSLHWPTIVKKADKEDLKSLGSIQSYIQKKTKYMDKMFLLKGKLEMLANTIEIRKASTSGAKAVAGEKSADKKRADKNLLVYKDADDDEDELMNDVDQQDSDEEDDDLDQDDEEEEIKEIDIKKRSKRQRKDQVSDDNDEEDQDMLDDSIDEESKDGIIGEDDDEEIDSEIYGGEDDDNDDDPYAKLAEDSDEDMDMGQDDEEEESDDEEIIKISSKKGSANKGRR